MRVLLWKEFRQHWPLLAVMVLVSVSVQILCLCIDIGINSDSLMVYLTWHIPIFYVGIASAVAYAQEDERKTYQYLRMLPIPGLTLLVTKILWVAIGLFIILLAATPVLYFGYDILSNNMVTNEPLYLPAGIVFQVLFFVEIACWGLFWSTRWPKQVFATMMTFLSECVVLAVFAVGLNVAIQNEFVDASVRSFWLDMFSVFNVLRLGVVLPVGFYAVRGALRWNVRRDRSNGRRAKKISVQHPVKNDPQAMLRRRVRSPFEALLVQSIRQSSHLLTAGLIVAIIYVVWLNVFWDALLHRWHEQWIQLMWMVVAWLGGGMLFLFSGSIFAEDFQNGAVRALIHRGVKPGLIWWSRILPFAAVYTIPIPWILWFLWAGDVSRGVPIPDNNYAIFKLALALFCGFCIWYIPFAFASFLAFFLKGPIKTAAATLLCTILFGWFAVFTWLQFSRDYLFVIFLLPPVFALIFSSRWQAEAWARERTPLQDGRRTLYCLLLIFAPFIIAWIGIGISHVNIHLP